MTTTLSRPKERIKILPLEGIADTAVAAIHAASYMNVERRSKALHGEALRDAPRGISMLGIRSGTQPAAEALDG